MFFALVLAPACDDKTETKTDDETKATDETKSKAEEEPEAKADAKPKAPPKPSKYRKGQTAPGGMTPEDIVEYARAQGDPKEGSFDFQDAFEGDATLSDKSKGKLTATIDTSMGSFKCELFEDKAPVTVANFVGLARGTRPWYDKTSDSWKEGEPYYANILWHRVMKDFMAQTGDRSKSGSGGPGYVIIDEIDTKKLKHRWKGTLSMANRELPNTGNSQFFVTVKPTPHLDGKHTVFGKCDPSVAKKISAVKVNKALNNRPYEPIKLLTIEISRE